MRTWVLGGSGLLGSNLVEQLQHPAPARVDVTDINAVRRRAAEVEIIINCAGWTNVDAAEMNEEKARTVNSLAVRDLTRVCAERGIWLFHISTDHVFAGDSGDSASEAEPVNPINAYGRTKAAGEAFVLTYERGSVIRTAWLYGRRQSSFVPSILNRAGQGRPFPVVDDQHGHPTFVGDAAERVRAIVGRVTRHRAPAGIWHAVNAGSTSRWQLASTTLALAGINPELAVSGSTRVSPASAPRPRFALLADERATRFDVPPMRGWLEALTQSLPGLLRL